MAAMEWNRCGSDSNGYEDGSERISFSCRDDGRQSIDIEIMPNEADTIFETGEQTAEISAGSLLEMQKFPGIAVNVSSLPSKPIPTYTLSIDANGIAASILKNFYDDAAMEVKIGGRKVRVYASTREDIKDMIADLYGACR
jgi:hypothetical protein